MTKEQLFTEVDELLRAAPDISTIFNETSENFSWLGQVSACISAWDPMKEVDLKISLNKLHNHMAITSTEGFKRLMILLHQMRHDLRMQTIGPLNVLIPEKMIFDYFDEIRKIINLANQDIFFIDPYLDADFAARYLPYVKTGVTIRLLSRERISTLLPAAKLFSQQENLKIEIRSAIGFHDRYVFVDKSSCYQSGASFKDGAKSSPTTITQIIDVFKPTLQTYENIWNSAEIEL